MARWCQTAKLAAGRETRRLPPGWRTTGRRIKMRRTCMRVLPGRNDERRREKKMIRRAGVVLGMLFLAHGAVAQFVQQGSKLVGTGTLGAAQGQSVAIAADGNTAIVGGPNDNVDTGAAWVFTRSSGVWSQQGNKLVCTAWFGGDASSVAISADGSTAITGGSSSDAHTGTSFRGACVFRAQRGVWSQQGDNSILRGSQSGAVLLGGTLGGRQHRDRRWNF